MAAIASGLTLGFVVNLTRLSEAGARRSSPRGPIAAIAGLVIARPAYGLDTAVAVLIATLGVGAWFLGSLIGYVVPRILCRPRRSH